MLRDSTYWRDGRAAASGVAENELAVQLDSERGDRIRYEFSGQAGISPGLFCLGDSRIACVLRIMHFLPNAVIRGGDFGISDLVSIRSLRPSHRRHWLVLAWHARGRRLLAFFRRDQSTLLATASETPRPPPTTK
jgi:hypothetical protein